jgi:tRNA-2-methylthio-N6-dimethylallyladenosine synthase
VGFPGESAAQFEQTCALLADLKLDVVHLARYSTRPGTVAERRMSDDVPEPEKMRRFRALEALQAQVLTDINARSLGQRVEVLVEGEHKGKWKGRTRTNKLAFFTAPGDWTGRLAEVTVTQTSPWSLQGEVASRTEERESERERGTVGTLSGQWVEGGKIAEVAR